MSETSRTTEDIAGGRNPLRVAPEQNMAIGNALRELAKKLGGKKGEIETSNDVREVLRDRGIMKERDTATVTSFPFEKTEEAQRELGREIGSMVKEIIEKQHQNSPEVSANNGTISDMKSEKPPSTTEKLRELNQITKEETGGVTEAKLSVFRQQLKDLQENMDKGSFSPDKEGGMEGDTISAKFLKKQIEALEIKLGEKTSNDSIGSITYKSPSERGSSEKMPPVSYRGIDGETIPMREGLGAKQEASISPQEIFVANEELGRSFLYDETIVRINKEIDGVRQKAKEATRQLRDHTKDAAEPQKILRQMDERMSELNRERTEHIRNKIKNASIEEVLVIKDVAHRILLDQNEMNETEAVDAMQAANSRIKEIETMNRARETPETTTPHIETIQEVGPEKQSPQEELVRIELERAGLLKKQRDNTITDIEQVSLRELTERTIILRGEISSAPQEEIVPPVNETAPTESAVPESSPVVSEITTPVSSQAEITTVVPEIPEETVASKEEILNPFEKAIARISSEDPARAKRLLATIGATPEMRERMEKLLGATETQAQKVEQETKEKDPWVVERLLKWGEWYRKVPLKRKLIASAVLMGGASFFAATGGVGAAMIATAALTGSGFQRFLGGLAVAITVEGVLTKRSLARNEEEEKIMGVRMNVILGALAGTGVFLGGKLLGDYLSSGGEHPVETAPPVQEPAVPTPESLDLNTKEILDSAQEKIKTAIPLPHEEMAGVNNSIMTPDNELFEHAATTESTSSIMTPENEIIGHAADRMVETTYAVHDGDNLWKIIEEKIPGIKDLDGEGRQSNAIANIIEQIKKDPESFGITSGNVDALSARDTIDLGKIHSVLETTTIPIEDGQSVGIIERASGLTDTEASHIISNNEKIAEWRATHPDAFLTTETVEKILSGTADGATSATPEINHLAEITKDYTLNMPDTGGRTIEQLAAEALSMNTDAVLHVDVQTMFGSKGFFGYGFLGTNGEKSVDWLDFKARAVSEVVSKKFDVLPVGEEGAVQKFGIDSPGAVDKLKGYITMLIEKAGTSPESNESVEHFSKRAISTIISKK